MAIEQSVATRMRVAVVDDDEDTRLFFQDILQAAKDFQFAGGFANAAEALDGIPRLQLDTVLMDVQMPGLNGVECTKRLKRAFPQLKIVMVTGRHDENSIQCSLQAGADAYLVKPIGADQCLATLRFVVINPQGRERERAEAGERLFPAPPAGTGLPISPRERDVLRGLAEGLLYKEISGQLGISYAAVHKYQHRLFKKLRVSNRSQAVRVWLDSGSR